MPKSAHGSVKLNDTVLGSRIIPAVMRLFEDICNKEYTVRRINITLTGLEHDNGCFQTDIFTNAEDNEREKHLQQAMLHIKKRYGKNAVLKGTSYEDGATMRIRNGQIGGHRA